MTHTIKEKKRAIELIILRLEQEINEFEALPAINSNTTLNASTLRLQLDTLKEIYNSLKVKTITDIINDFCDECGATISVTCDNCHVRRISEYLEDKVEVTE